MLYNYYNKIFIKMISYKDLPLLGLGLNKSYYRGRVKINIKIPIIDEDLT